MSPHERAMTRQDSLSSPSSSERPARSPYHTAEQIQAPLWQPQARFVCALSLLACFLLGAYYFYGFVVPQTPSRMSKASAALIPELPLWGFVAALPLPILSTPAVLSICLIGVAMGAFMCYALAVYLSWNRPSTKLTLGMAMVGSIVFFMVAMWSFPNTRTDIFNYIVNGRIAAVYSHNPYYVPAVHFPDDPIYPYAGKQYTAVPADAKLPVWTLISIALAWLAGDNPITNLLIYRGTFLLFNIANLALIALLLSKLKPTFLLAGVIAYGWHPIVAVFGQDKTDTVMVFFLLLAVLFLVHTRRWLGMASLALSVLVKLLTLPLIAVYGLREIRLGRWRELGSSVLVLGVTAVVTYSAFWDGPRMLFDHLNLLRAGGIPTPGALLLLVRVGFVLLVLGVGLTQDGSVEKLLRGWAVVMLYFALFLTKFGFTWYLLSLIALISLVLEWRLMLITIVLSFTSFLFNSWYMVSTPAFPLPDLLPWPRFVVYLALPCLTAIGLAALGSGKTLLRRYRLL